MPRECGSSFFGVGKLRPKRLRKRKQWSKNCTRKVRCDYDSRLSWRKFAAYTKHNNQRGSAENPPLAVDLTHERKETYSVSLNARATNVPGLRSAILLVDRHPSPVRRVASRRTTVRDSGGRKKDQGRKAERNDGKCEAK